ncbi:MAG: hypothetical protein ACRD1V_16380 [Vicinamibacterales bacterium]
MGLSQWMRVLESVTNFAQVSSQFRRPDKPDRQNDAAERPGGQLETRLANVLVAALHEAFDRDRARIDLERAHLDAERQRAEEALTAELRRQDLDRAQSRVRVVAVAAIAVWMLSAALAIWLPGMHTIAARVLLGAGWLLVLTAIASAFSSWRRMSDRMSSAMPTPGGSGLAEVAAMWSLLGAIALCGAALLTAL